MAKLFVEVLSHYRLQQKYLLHAFVLMPDHFHLLITPTLTLERAMQLVKGGFSYRARKELGINHEIWQPSYYDRRVRSVPEHSAFRDYIHLNPVKRRLTGFTILARHRMHKGAGQPYSPEDVDFIAAYIAPCQVWYLIPIEALKGGISIRVYPKLCPGGKTKRAGGFYETYREAWHLLKQPETIETAPNKQNVTNRELADNTVEPEGSPH